MTSTTPNSDQSYRLGKRLEEHTVDHAEDSRVCAYFYPERQKHSDGKP
jgi:hypothetical protein